MVLLCEIQRFFIYIEIFSYKSITFNLNCIISAFNSCSKNKAIKIRLQLFEEKIKQNYIILLLKLYCNNMYLL